MTTTTLEVSPPHRRYVFLAIGLLMFGCGGGGGGSSAEPQPPPPPPGASFTLEGEASVKEADNPLVKVSLTLDRAATGSVSAPVTITGTATRDYDYTASGDSLEIAAGETSASIELDIYRDFEAEDDETIGVEIGALTGEAVFEGATSVTVEILDGGGAFDLKAYEAPEPERQITETVVFITNIFATHVPIWVVFAFWTVEPLDLTGEIASNPEFTEGLRTIHQSHVTTEELENLKGMDSLALIQFPVDVPLADLDPDTHYYIRFHAGDATISLPEWIEAGHTGFTGFVTNSQGKVRVRCHAETRLADPSASDPLFPEQWHLVNTGQESFADAPGVPGADLRMSQAIEDGRSGTGVRVLVHDSGLEICHPDLAANVLPGESHRFNGRDDSGAEATDPFNELTLGDHGTSVAGILAAAADNGIGGRGVAPGVDLAGYDIGYASGDTFRALGMSEEAPDSASMHVFNMSYGSPFGQNPDEDLTRLYRHGASDLRDGLGALYVRASGNYFDTAILRACEPVHPLNLDLGCVNSNADGDQNLPYVLTVGGFNATDVKASYASVGANLWVVGPAGEIDHSSPGIVTTDQAGAGSGFGLFKLGRLGTDHPGNPDGDYTSLFAGTSSAAPALSGVVALLLEAEPTLTWRDVKHILAVSARKLDPERREVRLAYKGHPYVAQHAWVTNAAGYNFHNWYGFGAAAVDDAIALTGTHLPGSLGTFIESDWFEGGGAGGEDEPMPEDGEPGGESEPMPEGGEPGGEGDPMPEGGEPGVEGDPIPDADGRGLSRSMLVEGLPETANIEAVTLEISVEHPFPRELGMTIISPSGTPNVINPPFNRALGEGALAGWQIMSNAFYGESINGEWTLQVVDVDEGDAGSLTDWKLKFYYGEHGVGAASP